MEDEVRMQYNIDDSCSLLSTWKELAYHSKQKSGFKKLLI